MIKIRHYQNPAHWWEERRHIGLLHVSLLDYFNWSHVGFNGELVLLVLNTDFSLEDLQCRKFSFHASANASAFFANTQQNPSDISCSCQENLHKTNLRKIMTFCFFLLPCLLRVVLRDHSSSRLDQSLPRRGYGSIVTGVIYGARWKGDSNSWLRTSSTAFLQSDLTRCSWWRSELLSNKSDIWILCVLQRVCVCLSICFNFRIALQRAQRLQKKLEKTKHYRKALDAQARKQKAISDY